MFCLVGYKDLHSPLTSPYHQPRSFKVIAKKEPFQQSAPSAPVQHSTARNNPLLTLRYNLISIIKMSYKERILPPHDHKKMAKERCFPKTFPNKPSKLFPNTATVVNPPYVARFLSTEDIREALIFVAGSCDSTKAIPDRMRYGYVWGMPVRGDPIEHHVIHTLEDEIYPHAAERAQLHAIIATLRSSKKWKLEKHNHVLIAYSGDYILNEVVRVDLREQVEARKLRLPKEVWFDNLDLRSALADELEKMDDNRVMVRFWQVEAKENEAEKLFMDPKVPGAYPDLDDSDEYSTVGKLLPGGGLLK